MPVAAEWTDPLPYSGPWEALALLAAVVLVGYFAVLWWWAHPRQRYQAPVVGSSQLPVGEVRRIALAQVDRIEREVNSGALPARQGYQQLSEVVRGYVDDTTGLPARSMTLTDLRASRGAVSLAEAIEVMYPPEFRPGAAGEPQPGPRFAEAVGRSRQIVTHWGRGYS